MTRAVIPNRLTVSLNLEQSAVVEELLDQLKSRYRLEILEYDKTGKHLDDTVFYVRYAQAVRELIGDSEDEFLLSFLADTNHMAQELMARGCNPHQVFDSVLADRRDHERGPMATISMPMSSSSRSRISSPCTVSRCPVAEACSFSIHRMRW